MLQFEAECIIDIDDLQSKTPAKRLISSQVYTRKEKKKSAGEVNRLIEEKTYKAIETRRNIGE